MSTTGVLSQHVGAVLGFRTIVVGTDFSDLSSRGLAAALRLSQSHRTQRLHLVHVLPAGGRLPPFIAENKAEEAAQRAIRSAEERLQSVAAEAGHGHGVEVSLEVRVGSPARELARAAEEQTAELLVVASYSSLAQLVLGSVASSLIRVARCPVLVVTDRGTDADHFERVLAAVDLSPISRNVLHNAVVAAAVSRGQVRVLSLFEPPILRPDPDGWLPKYIGPDELEEVAAHRNAEVSALIRRSVPGNAVSIEVEVQARQPVPEGILEEARDWSADLLVMGTSGHNAWHRMILGSTTHHVLLKAACAVLVVPQEVRDEVKDASESLAVAPALESGS